MKAINIIRRRELSLASYEGKAISVSLQRYLLKKRNPQLVEMPSIQIKCVHLPNVFWVLNKLVGYHLTQFCENSLSKIGFLLRPVKVSSSCPQCGANNNWEVQKYSFSLFNDKNNYYFFLGGRCKKCTGEWVL